MPTPTRAFLDVAARHGIDPSDVHAVQEWYTEVLPTLPAEQIEGILEELLQRDATVEDRPEERCYPQHAPLPSLDDSPPAQIPVLAAHWKELFRIMAGRLTRRQERKDEDHE